MDFADYPVNRGKAAAISGSAFGENGESYLRPPYATVYERIEEAANRIEKAIVKLH